MKNKIQLSYPFRGGYWTMEQRIAVEAQPELSRIVEEVRHSGQPLVITRGGKEQAALIDIRVFDRFMEDQRLEQQVDTMLARLAERNKSSF
jgi:prevent-host-death family protein